MRRRRSAAIPLPWWLIAGAVMLAALLLLMAWLLVLYLRNSDRPAAVSAPTAVMTVLAPPTLTPVIPTPTPNLTPTVTPLPTSPSSTEIGVGAYVQISGTEGDGLRLRAGPGTGAEPIFLGAEAEVFQVQEGPTEADGITWWYLVAPYDKTRAGWAAGNYLAVIPPPTPAGQ